MGGVGVRTARRRPTTHRDVNWLAESGGRPRLCGTVCPRRTSIELVRGLSVPGPGRTSKTAGEVGMEQGMYLVG
jgi:hypothetical protein